MALIVQRSLMLAAWAPVSAAARLTDAADGGATVMAGCARAVIYGTAELEAAGAAVTMDVVADTAATTGNRGVQRGAYGVGKPVTAAAADPAGGAQRRDAGLKQALGGIDVADTDQQVSVHQHRLDRRAFTLDIAV